MDRRGVVLDDLQVDDDERDLHAPLCTQRNETASFHFNYSNFGVKLVSRLFYFHSVAMQLTALIALANC